MTISTDIQFAFSFVSALDICLTSFGDAQTVEARNADQVSVTQSQSEPQTGRIQGTVVSLIRNPGSHGPGVPETREANVKCTDKTEGNWMSVDIVISEGNRY
ncbi:hypothetical protein L3X38_032548 [Prunus dulcis]|uniref:Uncharacterized protein n=1 Tax=Prunus dulcis TaxID=3755 RepID=A0AAD4VGF8_PRUDU|nr:hypothetical protein L3X38_032548 [Prunus dulcis]